MFGLKGKLNKWLFINLLLVLGIVSLSCVMVPYPGADVYEHIRASLRIFKGETPFIDFFEHHNMLLWYISGWFIDLFHRNSEVVSILNYITFLCFLIGVFFIYKTIVRFMGNVTYGLISVIMILLPADLLYYVYYRPDNFMLPALMVGMYYFFAYIEERKRKDLILSYLGFWVGFLFLQKALMFYPVIGVFCLYMLFKKEMKISDFLWAICIPVVGSLLIVGYLYSKDILSLYWESCFTFNVKNREYMEEFALFEPWEWAKVIFAIGVICYVILFKNENIYFRLWGGVFIFNLLFKYFYFSPHYYYFYETYMVAVAIAVIGLFKIISRYKVLKWILFFEVQCFIFFNMYCLINTILVHSKKQERVNEAQEFIIRATNPCDSILTEYTGVYNKNLGYYWFLRGHMDLVGERAGFGAREDVNKLIEEHKPQLIYVDDVYDKVAGYKGQKILLIKYDMDMIKKYYNKTNRLRDRFVYDKTKDMFVRDNEVEFGFYELKPEYRKLKGKCLYNEAKKEWKYEHSR